MFTRISLPSSTKEGMNLDNYGIRHPFGGYNDISLIDLGVFRLERKG